MGVTRFSFRTTRPPPLMIGKTKLLLKLTLCSVLVTYGTCDTMKTGNVIKHVVDAGHATMAGYVVMQPTEVCTPLISSKTNKATEYETITCVDATTVRVDKFSDAGCKTKTSSKVLKVHQAVSLGPGITPTCAMGVKTSGYAYHNYYTNSTTQCGATNLCKSEFYAAGICHSFTQKVSGLYQSMDYSKNGKVMYSDANCKTPIQTDPRYDGGCIVNDGKKKCKDEKTWASFRSLGVTPYVATMASSTSPSASFGFLSLAAAAIVASMRA